VRGVTVEAELMLRLAQVASRRDASRSRIRGLAAAAEPRRLAASLAEAGLLPLLGRRLRAIAPDALGPGFAAEVEESHGVAARRALMLEAVTIQATADLAGAGIRSLPLKGPFLARSIHDDPGLRVSLDTDLLIAPSELGAAVDRLVARGWRRPPDHVDRRGRPALHFTFIHEQPWMPPLELHWRVHWYEERFSTAMLARSVVDGPVRRALPPDELMALLLFLARDGFLGLRLPADLAAWWDARQAELPPGGLEGLVDQHPELRVAVASAAAVTERLVGVPAERLLSPATRAHASVRATRLANPFASGDVGQVWGNCVLVDGLLTPRTARREFVHRQFIAPPEPHVLGPDPRTPRGRVERWLRAPRIARRAAVALWRTRGNRAWAALPD
jgi:hypothetical protein